MACIEGREEFTVKEWAEGLAGLNGQQIKIGIDTFDGDWPPSLNEFKKACRGSKGRLHHGAAYQDAPALPKPEITPEQLKKRRGELMAEVEKFRTSSNTDEKDDFVSDPAKRAKLEAELKELGLME